MKTHVFRLTKNMDLLHSLKKYCEESNIAAGTIASSVGCVHKATIRNAGGVEIIELNEDLEIISLNGTISKNRCHLHAAFAKKDLSVIGGHLCEGCLVNTTCELVLLELDDYTFMEEFDQNTGYDELKINHKPEEDR